MLPVLELHHREVNGCVQDAARSLPRWPWRSVTAQMMPRRPWGIIHPGPGHRRVFLDTFVVPQWVILSCAPG